VKIGSKGRQGLSMTQVLSAGKTVSGMQEQRVVALYGNSLLMEIVEASLGSNQELGVVRVTGSSSGAVVERLKSLRPDMIVVDSSEPDARFVLSFFKDRAGVPVLCLDSDSNKAMILSCQHYTSLTTTDLTDLVQAHASGRIGGSLRNGEMLLS
jgi:ABC-type Fe3+-hydroxamate transport system substrate-binding protein